MGNTIQSYLSRLPRSTSSIFSQESVSDSGRVKVGLCFLLGFPFSLRFLSFGLNVLLLAMLLNGMVVSVHAQTLEEPNEFTAKVITTNQNHSCMIDYGGTVRCWGYNFNFRLGVSFPDILFSSRPVQVPGLTTGVTTIAAGRRHTCVIHNNITKCWGSNSLDQLGGGTDRRSSLPVQIPGLSRGVTEIGIGNDHTCVIDNGVVKCWGSNFFSQSGGGIGLSRRDPFTILGLTANVTGVASGYSYSCAIDSDGAKCWGDNSLNQLGSGSTVSMSSTPVQVFGLETDVTAIAAGEDQTCAIHRDEVKCWGSNRYGGLGVGTTTESYTPVRVLGLTANGVTAMAVSRHSCVIDNGAAKCWGRGHKGQLGDGSSTSRFTPVQVLNLTSNVTGIATGEGSTCAIHTDLMKCWGSNDWGELGNGDYGNGTSRADRSSPMLVLGQLVPRELAQPQAIVTTNTITIKWGEFVNGHEKITSYLITWRSDLDLKSRQIDVLGSISSYKITGLQPNMIYHIAMAAVNTVGQGEFSTTLTVQTAALPPLSPTRLSSQNVESDRIEISWTAPDIRDSGAAITGYRVYWGSFGMNEISTGTQAPTTSYTMRNLLGGNTYKVIVAAVNRSGIGARSAVLTVQTHAAIAPRSPQFRRIDRTTDSITVNWYPPDSDGGSPIVEYTVFYNSTADNLSVGMASTVLFSETSYTIKALSPLITYEVSVRASNDRGLGDSSTVLSLRTLGHGIKLRIKALLEGALQ